MGIRLHQYARMSIPTEDTTSKMNIYPSLQSPSTYFIDTALLLAQSPYNSLGQTILNDTVVPPYRVWEPAGYTLQRFELGEMLIKDRSEAIRNWVDEQARFGWFQEV